MLCKVMGWSWDQLLALPADVYRELLAMAEDGTLTGRAPGEE